MNDALQEVPSNIIQKMMQFLEHIPRQRAKLSPRYVTRSPATSDYSLTLAHFLVASRIAWPILFTRRIVNVDFSADRE